MSDGKVRAYVAVSLDGFIADASGGVGWLDRFNSPTLGFEEFFAGIGTVVVGRTTYDWSIGVVPDAYGAKDVIVVTGRPLAGANGRVRACGAEEGALARAVGEARGRGDVWVCGGGKTFRLAFGLIERWELFIMPVFLGAGVPLLGSHGGPVDAAELELELSREHGMGIVERHYRRV
jgi:dihydrofolate reductase